MITSWFQTAITPWRPFAAPEMTAAAIPTTGGAGVVYGYNRTTWYNGPDRGTCNLTLMRDIRNPQAITTIEFLGIFTQGGNFLVIGWQDRPDVQPTTDMPEFTGNVEIVGGSKFYETGRYPGLHVNTGYKGLAWQVPLNFTVGQTVKFNFIPNLGA